LELEQKTGFEFTAFVYYLLIITLLQPSVDLLYGKTSQHRWGYSEHTQYLYECLHSSHTQEYESLLLVS